MYIYNIPCIFVLCTFIRNLADTNDHPINPARATGLHGVYIAWSVWGCNIDAYVS